MRRKTLWRVAAVVIGALVIAGGVVAMTLFRHRPAQNVAADGLALAGYDPVSYFAEGGGRPRIGDPRWTASHEGRRYQFATAENRERFVAAPERFEPQFGGWCAYAVAHGHKFEVDPESFLIADDRLLLFYKGLLGNAWAEFEKEGVATGLRQADANWPALAAD